MDRREFGWWVGVSGMMLASRGSGQEVKVRDLSGELETIRKEHGVPGIAAAVVHGKQLIAEGVAGVRRVGGEETIAIDDRFGMASCTKRMTAAMICRLVEAGKLAFETTLSEALAEMPMREEYKTVTVKQLLTHMGGIPPYTIFMPPGPAIFREAKGTALEKREQFIQHLLQEEPVVKPGTEFRYSNAGYALVGYVAEQRTGKTWEMLMQEEVFSPLAMKSAGFGRPWSKERPNEPVLHRQGNDGYEPEPAGQDVPLQFLAPAGDVHCSIRDFSKFASEELAMRRGEDSLIKAETARKERQGAHGPMLVGKGEPVGKGEKGPKVKRLTGPGKAGKSGPDGAGRDWDGFYGGSAYISSGCMLWPAKNLAVVAAVNGGGAGEAVNAVAAWVKEAGLGT